MERVLLVLFTILLFYIPFIGWETGWQTEPTSFINIVIYMITFVIGLSMLFSHIQKKHLPDEKLIKISILIALLFSPMVLTAVVVFAAVDILLPSALVLPLTLLELITGEEDFSSVPFHHFIIPVITFLFIYTMLWIITRRYHLFPDRPVGLSRHFFNFLKIHNRAVVIITVLLAIVVSLRIISQIWVSRYYLPVLDRNSTLPKHLSMYSYIAIPNTNPLSSLLVKINCTNLEGFEIFKLNNNKETIECVVENFLVLRKESKSNFKFTKKQFELREIKEDNYIYPYIVHSSSQSIGDVIGPPSRSIILQYVFNKPPKQIELVIPDIQIESKKYKLSPLRFEYKEDLRFGRPYE